jgi:hypothetical protein
MLIKNVLTIENKFKMENVVKWCKKRFQLRLVLYFATLSVVATYYIWK